MNQMYCEFIKKSQQRSLKQAVAAIDKKTGYIDLREQCKDIVRLNSIEQMKNNSSSQEVHKNAQEGTVNGLDSQAIDSLQHLATSNKEVKFINESALLVNANQKMSSSYVQPAVQQSEKRNLQALHSIGSSVGSNQTDDKQSFYYVELIKHPSPQKNYKKAEVATYNPQKLLK